MDTNTIISIAAVIIASIAAYATIMLKVRVDGMDQVLSILKIRESLDKNADRPNLIIQLNQVFAHEFYYQIVLKNVGANLTFQSAKSPKSDDSLRIHPTLRGGLPANSPPFYTNNNQLINTLINKPSHRLAILEKYHEVKEREVFWIYLYVVDIKQRTIKQPNEFEIDVLFRSPMRVEFQQTIVLKKGDLSISEPKQLSN